MENRPSNEAAGESGAAEAGTPPPERVRGRRPAQGDPVIDRAFALLGSFSPTHRQLTLGELSRRSGIPTSSALRLANQLMAWGALERDAKGQFSIGVRLLELTSLAPRGHGLRQVAMPFMGDLAEVTHQHVQLAVLDGQEATLVERLSSHHATPVQYRVGGRLPLHATGVGLVLLAFAPTEFQEEVLARPLYRPPDPVPVNPTRLRQVLAEVRRERVAVFRRKETEPLMSVAAPVYGPDDAVVAALSILLPEREADARRLGLAVRTAAQAISRELGARRSIGMGVAGS
jgi:DNA-binding IclR family transcriptional regulator